MPPMPYYLEKGPMLSVVESYLNSSTSNAVSTLRALRIAAGAAGHIELWELPPFASSAVAGRPGNPYGHDFRDRWLGKGVSATTMWMDYDGDVEDITRQTVRTALEVALGVNADSATVPDQPPRHWPIDLYWKCGQNWFEGWVTHRRFGPGSTDGHVVVVFATPSEGSVVVGEPADSPRLKRGADYAKNPTSTLVNGTESVAGMLVITHARNRATPTSQVRVTRIDTAFPVILNPARYVGDLDVIVVAPGEADGGVLAIPRPYVP